MQIESIKYTLQGAHLFHWQPINSNAPILFCSNKALFQPGKAIRGGVPICWPWFGPKHGFAQHGFVRTSDWTLVLDETKEDKHRILLSLNDSDATFSIFPFKFHLLLEIVESIDQLIISLTTTNKGNQPFQITSALHTYFNIGDISEILIDGLQNYEYYDKIDNLNKKEESRHLKIQSETDRIYNTSATTTIIDPILNRTIKIEHDASSIVIWNPWQEKSKVIADLEDDDYKKFICIESAFAPEQKSIQPQQSLTLKQSITVQTM